MTINYIDKTMKNKKIIDVTPDVKWIGILDYDLVTFDVVMTTEYGSTYNSYFIDAEKKTIIDTSKETFWNDYEAKVRAVVNPEEIEYIILNHTEPDHSGNLKNLLKIAPKATVVASNAAIKYLKDMLHEDFRHQIVRDGDTLDLGNKTLRFISAPNLHWPDTMYTYLEDENLLFTCDSFGCHFADENMFDDNVDDFNPAFRYYFDVIIKPFSKFMLKAIEKIKPLEIDMILPGHGPMLRKDWKRFVDMTKMWSEKFIKQPHKDKVFIPYVSAYHKTGIIAEYIAEGLKQAGEFDIEVLDIEQLPLGVLDSKLTQSAAIIVGSPVINQNILMPVYKLFSLINPYRDKGKLAGGFGSYGWSGENKEMIKTNLTALKLKYFGEGVFIKFGPNDDEKAQAIAYGKAFGEELNKMASK
jgi:flavorubredoxin